MSNEERTIEPETLDSLGVSLARLAYEMDRGFGLLRLQIEALSGKVGGLDEKLDAQTTALEAIDLELAGVGARVATVESRLEFIEQRLRVNQKGELKTETRRIEAQSRLDRLVVSLQRRIDRLEELAGVQGVPGRQTDRPPSEPPGSGPGGA